MSDPSFPVLALDLGGTKLAAALVSGNRVLERRQVPTPEDRSPDHIVQTFMALSENWLERVCKIAVAATGHVTHGRVTAPNRQTLPWTDVDLKTLLEQSTGKPTTVLNDADAAALVAGLKAVAPFEISVACYPEVHPQASCPVSDLDNLKRKVDAGADRAISQFFFSPEAFLRFRDRAAAAGISAEIVPGILPVSSVAQTRNFAGQCGAAIPAWMDQLFDGLDDKPAARQLVAATVAAELCGQLYAGGIRHFHFYTLNRAELAYAICHLLGLRAKAST